MASNPYHRLTVAQKQRAAISRAREPGVTCPACGAQTDPAELVDHVRDRCPGVAAGDPHHLARWVTWGEAVKMGCREATLSGWIAAGIVRSRGRRTDGQYLLRDLAVALAIQLMQRRLIDRRRRDFGAPKSRRRSAEPRGRPRGRNRSAGRAPEHGPTGSAP